MRVAQMPIDLHGERTAVLVAKPPADRGDVNARFNAPRGEEMAQVVMRESGDSERLAGSVNSPLALLHAHHRSVQRFLWSISPQSFQQSTAVGYHGHSTSLAVFCACLGVSSDHDLPALEIAVRPRHVRGFAFYSQTSVRKELDQIRAGKPGSEGNAANLLN